MDDLPPEFGVQPEPEPSLPEPWVPDPFPPFDPIDPPPWEAPPVPVAPPFEPPEAPSPSPPFEGLPSPPEGAPQPVLPPPTVIFHPVPPQVPTPPDISMPQPTGPQPQPVIAPPGVPRVPDVALAGLDSILNIIGAQLGNIHGRLSDVAAALVARAGDALAAVQIPAQEIIAGATFSISQLLGTLLGNLTSNTDLWASLLDAIRQRWPDMASPLATLASSAVPAGLASHDESIEAALRPLVAGLVGDMATSEDTPEQFRPLLASLANPPHFALAPWLIAAGAGIVGALLARINAPGLTAFGQLINRSVGQEIPGVDMATLLLLRHYISPEQFEYVVSSAGFPRQYYQWFINALQQRLTPLDYTLGAQRKFLSDGDASAEMRELGLRDQDALLMTQLAKVQPGVSDLVLFLVREVFNPALRARLDLDAAFPTAAIEQFAKIGVSEELARNYWAAHWQLPSAGQAFEMFQRGVITRQDLDSLLQAQDYAPVWRDKLTAIAYNPLTRVDIRRMHAMGVLSRQQTYEAYLSVGYSPENADNLLRFTETLNDAEKKAERELVRGSMRSRIVADFLDGTLSETRTREALKGLLYHDPEIDALVSQAVYERESDKAKAVADGVKRLYVKGLWSRDEATAELQTVGFEPVVIDGLFAGWDIARRYRELTSGEERDRDLTRADVIAALHERIISLQDAHDMLRAMRYDEHEVSIIISLAEAKRLAADAKEDRESIRVRYVAGKIDRNDAVTALDKTGATSRQRDILVAKWDAERDKREADIPLTSLVDMARLHILSADDFAAELRRRGFTEADVTRLVAWAGYKTEAARAKVTETLRKREERLTGQLTRVLSERTIIAGLPPDERAARLAELDRTEAEIHRELDAIAAARRREGLA